MHLRTKIGIWVIGGLVAIIVALAAFAQFGSEIKRHRLVEVAVDSIVIPTDQAALERGRYLFRSRGCADCHGSDGGGRVFLDESGLRAKSPHISPGPGSVTVGYAAEDWVRTIRHGVKPNGEPLLIMPSEDFDRFTDADVGAIAAYVRSLPAVEGTGAEFDIPLPMRLLYAAGMIQDAAEKIDHTLAPQQPPAPTDRLAAGAYVAEICKGCHNDSFSGGPIAGGSPNWPPAANLTPGEGGVLDRYPSAEALAAMFRSGKRPDGSAISDAMPAAVLGEMSDAEISDLYAFLKSLPAKKTGER